MARFILIKVGETMSRKSDHSYRPNWAEFRAILTQLKQWHLSELKRVNNQIAAIDDESKENSNVPEHTLSVSEEEYKEYQEEGK